MELPRMMQGVGPEMTTENLLHRWGGSGNVDGWSLEKWRACRYIESVPSDLESGFLEIDSPSKISLSTVQHRDCVARKPSPCHGTDSISSFPSKKSRRSRQSGTTLNTSKFSISFVKIEMIRRSIHKGHLDLARCITLPQSLLPRLLLLRLLLLFLASSSSPCQSLIVSEDEIRKQEARVRTARKRLEEELDNMREEEGESSGEDNDDADDEDFKEKWISWLRLYLITHLYPLLSWTAMRCGAVFDFSHPNCSICITKLLLAALLTSATDTSFYI